MEATQIDWSTAKWAKAREVVRWLNDAYPGGHEALMEYLASTGSDRWQRRYFEWRRSPRMLINVELALDEFLIYLGLTLSEVPEWVFSKQLVKGGQRRKPMTKDEIKAIVRIAKKEGAQAAAKKVKCHKRTVEKYVRLSKAAA